MMTDQTDETAEAIVTRAASAFDAAWRQWGPPKIKFYLRDVRPDCRQAALMRLVRVDLEHRMRLGERPAPARYAEQFPRIFGTGTPERQQLTEIIRRLLTDGPPPAMPLAANETSVDVAPAMPPTDADPSDWIESLGEYSDELEGAGDVNASGAELNASTTPIAAQTRRHRALGAKVYLVAALVVLSAGSLIYVIAQATTREPTFASASVSASATAPAPLPQTRPVPLKVATPAPPVARIIDLLPLIDVSADAASGKWTRSGRGPIDSDNSSWAMLRIPYQPPEEYDLDVEFERLPGGAGGASTGLIGSAPVGSLRTCFEWNVWLDNETCGFWLIDDKPWREGPPGARGAVAPNAGGRHTARLSVRRDGVEGYLDGVRVAGWKTDFRDLSLPHADEWGGPVLLGLRTYENPTRFFAVKLTEVSGEGRRLRE